MVRALLLAGTLLSSLGADPRSEAVDQLLSAWRTANSPGCAIGVIQNGQFVQKTVFGLADLEQKAPISSSTAFNLASMSKQFTAAALYFLVESGKLRIADPVRRYIPELPAYAESMIVGDLLHHTSGLRDIAPLLEVSGRLGELTDVAANLKLLVAQSALNFPPGTDYEYTNSDYLLLGVIVERVSGVSLAEFTEDHIFRPLEMVNSQFRARIGQLRDPAAGYAVRGGQFRKIASPLLLAGDGGLYASLDDLLRWDQNFYSGKLGGRAFLDFMETRGRLRSGEPLDYAAGLVVGHYRGLHTVSHDGWLPGFRSELIRFPEQHLSVACLCNRGDVDTSELARSIAAIYLSDKLKRPARAANLDYGNSIFPELGGSWESRQGWIIRTWSSVNGLTVELPEGQFQLAPLNHHQMFADPGGFRLVLTEMGHDRIRLRWDGLPPVEYDRLRPAMPPKQELAALAGNYRSPDAGAQYRVFLSEQGRLMMTMNSGWRMRLEPIGSDRFVFGPWSLRFTRDASGNVQGMELHRARLWNLQFERAAE